MKSVESGSLQNSCEPCVNDVLGQQASNIRLVMANNLSVLKSFKNMKCAILAYINAVSVEFVQSINHSDEDAERSRFNVLIESLIAGIHQALRSFTNGKIEPYFQLWIQKTDDNGDNTYDIGNGGINNTNGTAYCTGNSSADADTCGQSTSDGGTATCQESTDGGETYSTSTTITDNLATACVDSCSVDTYTSKGECEAAGETWTNRYVDQVWNDLGGEGQCSNSLYTTREECLKNVDLFGFTNTWSVYGPGNIAKLYPSKISLTQNCNKNNSTVGDQILYHYNPSVQLLYDPEVSSLKLKWSDASYTYDPTFKGNNCLFPLLSDEDAFKSQIYVLVPPSPVGDEYTDIWNDQRKAYNFVRKNCLLDNKDLKSIISQLEIIIRRCELTHESLKLKLKMSVGNYAISKLDPITNSMV